MYNNRYSVNWYAQNFADGVNGSLRKGDIVDVFALDPVTELLTLYAENVYVAEVYDNAGNKVTEPDGIATAFTVWVTPEEVENLNLAVVYGGVHTKKVRRYAHGKKNRIQCHGKREGLLAKAIGEFGDE